MPYIEFTGPPASGKTTQALAMLRDDPTLASGRRSLQTSGRSERRLSRLGLPREGVRMWLRLLGGLPRDAVLAIRFWRDCGSFHMGARMLSLLVKARAQASSARMWVVDQGLQQQVLTACADRRVKPPDAQRWMALCRRPPWGPQRLIALTLDRDALLERIAGSEKHRRQCDREPPGAYVERYLSLMARQP
jgi:hypothetical protein